MSQPIKPPAEPRFRGPDPDLFCSKCNHQLEWDFHALEYVRATDHGRCIDGCKPRERQVGDAPA